MHKIKILILSANPKDTDKLRLDEELREIKEALKLAKKHDLYEIIVESAVRVDDLRRALLEYTPQIVHFSGHGGGSHGIALENNSGKMQLVSTASLARLFKFFKDNIHCVFLNACYSEVQANAICKHINYVVGMNQAVGDRAAIEFAKGFYDALGAGRSFEEAYELGCTSIDLESIPESSTPVLKIREGQISVPPPTPPSEGEPKLPPDPPESSPIPVPVAPLEIPEGQVPLDSPFYIERPPIEVDCYETILRPGALIRVKAPRQMGKSSLLSRILDAAAQQDYEIAALSFQSADAKYLTDLDQFLKWFCACITNELGLPNKINEYWADDFLGSKDKCTNYFQRYLLAEVKHPLALGLDEVDEVFKHPEVAVDFFGLLRAWHEKSKNNRVWQKLRLVLSHSKEVYIPLNINQSPFNVGVAVELPLLTTSQVQELVFKHGLDWSNEQLEQVMSLFGGHPFLVRMAFYQLAKGRVTLETLKQVAATEESFYSDHLRRHLLNLRADDALFLAARKVFANPGPINVVQVGSAEAFKLRSMGIVKTKGNDVIPLCTLYWQYFSNRLEVG
ncbi:AAA-like domain-containing protein [Pantanalinema rosaneae CENA516]|uniref:AAA-like domain-containing protein n=1 Tax=Pantanalinema rosaneae TaxID=1620701 RepID=UPI003D6DD59B